MGSNPTLSANQKPAHTTSGAGFSVPDEASADLTPDAQIGPSWYCIPRESREPSPNLLPELVDVYLLAGDAIVVTIESGPVTGLAPA